MKPAAGCRALIEGDCEAGPCDDAAGPIVDQEVRRHADWTAVPARRIQNSEGPLRVVFCLTELGLNLSQGFLAAKISIMFYGKWNVLETDTSTFDIA